MNERVVTEFLATHITEKKVAALSQAANTAYPGSGVAVAILGALVVRAIVAAKEYIERIDAIPIVPPDLPPSMTYSQAVDFFEDKKLSDTFKELLSPAADPENSDKNRARVLVARAASAVKKCFDGNDGIFNLFYRDQIVKKDYLTVWEKYGEFLKYKADLRDALPPADFKPMLNSIIEAVKKEGIEQVKESKAYRQVKERIEKRINEIAPDISDELNLDKIIDQLGSIV